MEVINTQGNDRPPVDRNHRPPVRDNRGAWVVALIFIAVGLIWLGYNTGAVSRDIFRVVISWQMLLIVLGITMLFKRESFVGGAILIGVGGFFMMSKFVGWVSLGTYWPLVFVVVGVVILVSMLGHRGYKRRNNDR